MKELEQKLNKEYEEVAVITINEMHSEIIPIKDINYVCSIMQDITPLDIDEPIVVSKSYTGKYKLIDGYHRLKHKLGKEQTINAYILDRYSINRKNDTLFDFIKSLVGKKITFISSEEISVEDKLFLIESNDGCGGCGNGWSSINVKPDFIGKKIKVTNVESKSKFEDSDEYELIINDEVVADVDTGWGNGYYGGDFVIKKIN